MMSVKDIIGSLVITILPHLGDNTPSGGGLSGRFFSPSGLPCLVLSIVNNFDLEIILLFYVCYFFLAECSSFKVSLGQPCPQLFVTIDFVPILAIFHYIS